MLLNEDPIILVPQSQEEAGEVEMQNVLNEAEEEDDDNSIDLSVENESGIDDSDDETSDDETSEDDSDNDDGNNDYDIHNEKQVEETLAPLYVIEPLIF